MPFVCITYYESQAWWEGESLRSEIVFEATHRPAYSADWRLVGDAGRRLRYTLSRDGVSMWVALKLDERGSASSSLKATSAEGGSQAPAAALKEARPAAADPPPIDDTPPPAAAEPRLVVLARGLAEAVAAEDYLSAARIKAERDALDGDGAQGSLVAQLTTLRKLSDSLPPHASRATPSESEMASLLRGCSFARSECCGNHCERLLAG